MQTGSPTLGARLFSGSHRMPEHASEPASQVGQKQTVGDIGLRPLPQLTASWQMASGRDLTPD